MLSKILYFQVDKLLKESCDANGEYCQFHQRFLNFLRTLPSKGGYNDFSVFKLGKVSQNARVEWISNAIWKIFGYSADKFMSGNPSITKFFEELENYNFVEFFQNETNPDY